MSSPGMLGSGIVVTSASARRCGVGAWSSASRTPVQAARGSGARNRRSPDGGSAYGMPRKAADPGRQRPRTEPAGVSTTTVDPRGSRASGVVPAKRSVTTHGKVSLITTREDERPPMTSTRPEDDTVLTELLAALPLEEKILLLTGRDFWNTWPLERIGLRNMVVSDGPSGVRGEVWDERDPSLSFPSATALASAWDPQIAH